MSCCSAGVCNVRGHSYDGDGYCNGVDNVVGYGVDHGKFENRDHHHEFRTDDDDDRKRHHRIIVVGLLCPELEQSGLQSSWLGRRRRFDRVVKCSIRFAVLA